MTDAPKCSSGVIHQDKIDMVSEKMLAQGMTQDLADFFKVFGDETRIKLLYSLSLSELCVCDISAVLGMSQSAISHQLRVLKNARLVQYRREGKTVYYSLDDEHIGNILSQGIVHVMERRRGSY